ncbi:MAG: acyl-Coenzyme dehydrogenase [Frankiales bacterium]|nr:acyl-Coenzyme dehydrogenase [Frankiales bacterium]
MTTDTSVDPLSVVDQPRLHAFLSTLADTGPDLAVGVLSGGLSNLTYVASTGGHQYVVRRRPLGAVPKGAHDMAREYRVQAALQGTDLPLARTYGFCADESVLGAPGYVMSLVPGRVLHTRADAADLTAGQAKAVCSDVVDTLVRLHAIDVEAVGLAELGRPAGFVRRRIAGWIAQWRAAEHRDLPLVEALEQHLLDAVPPHTDETLVHGDYRLGNMIIDVEHARIAALLDWEMSTLGDPLTDLAHLLVYWESSRGRQTHDSQTIAAQPGFATGAELVAAYATASGRDVSALDFYLAFEHWRAAVIKEGIYTRHVQGNQAGAEGVGDSVLRHLEEAADLLGVTR